MNIIDECMRFEYDGDGDLKMYPDNEYEYDIMNRICKEIFGYKLTFNYEHYFENGIILAYSNETNLKSIIEKMRDDNIERILQIKHENKWIRFVARVMIELWG